MPFLRQSTAQVIRFGPCLDKADGVTEETTLTLAQADMRLSKDGGAFAQKSAAGNATHDSDGWYSTTLSTTDTATVGELVLNVHQPTNMLPIWARWWVVEEAIYDAFYGAAAAGFSTIVAVEAVQSTSDAIVVDTADIQSRIPAALVGGAIDADVSAIQANAITEASLATDASEEIADAVWDEILTGGTHNIATSAGRRLRQLQESGAVYGGFIWIDTVNGTAGTTAYENGTSDNPVNTIADANTLAAALGIPRFQVAPGSSITFAATQSNEMFFGREWTLALGGQNIAGSYFEGAAVTGTGTGSNAHFAVCEMGTTTLANCRMGFCRFTGTITFSAASDYYFHDCYSGMAGASTPTIDFGAAVANTNLSMRRYSGGVTINNKDNTGMDQMSLEGDGQLIVAASSGGAIKLRGNFSVTNTGGATITYDDDTQGIVDIEVDTADIQTRLPAALVGGAMDSDVSVIQTNAVSADALAPDAVQEIADAILPPINTAFSDISVFMRDSTDHFTPKTGLTLTVTRSIDGGGFVSATGTPAEIGNGYYQFDASAADMNGKLITFRFVSAGADDSGVVVITGG